MSLELTPKSFIVISGGIFNSRQTVAENVELIDAGKPIKIIATDNFRTGFTDVLEIDLLVKGPYSIGDKDQYTVLQDGKERAEQEAKEYREKLEAEKSEKTEETTEEVEQETLEANQ